MELDELMNQPKWKAAGIRGQIMAMMLNGELDWDKGCAIRNLTDERLIEHFDEEHTDVN